MDVMNRRLLGLVLLLVGLYASASLAVTSNLINGRLQSGEGVSATPLKGVPVRLYFLTANAPQVVASAITDASGHFVLATPANPEQGSFYLDATLGNGVELTSLLGPDVPSASVVVNEKTSIASAYALAQFSRTGQIVGSPHQLSLASGMVRNLVDPSLGTTSTVLLNSPNGDQTASRATLNSLSNLLAWYVKNPVRAGGLYALTPNEAGDPPQNSPTALSNLARIPSENVKSIYQLSQKAKGYRQRLNSSPDVWVLAVKIHNSGDPNRLIGGVGNIAFDQNGYAWVTNNVVQGTTLSSDFILLFKPDGSPSDGSNGYLPSPIQGGGILGQGFGITVDKNGKIWSGNFGWGGVNPSSTAPGSGSITQQTAGGVPLSVPSGYYGGTYRAQSLDTDSKNNLWIASYGNSSVCVFLGGDPKQSSCFQQPQDSNTFGLGVAQDDTVWIANTGSYSTQSSVAKFKLQGTAISQVFNVPIGQSLKGLSIDSQGNAWVASGSDNKVYALKPDGSLIGAFDGGGMSGPWSTTIDGEDNVWVANFGPFSGNFSKGRITKLSGASNPRYKPGTPLSPKTGYNLKSQGKEVLLANGEPLYGTGKGKCFCPLMRLTTVAIDQAGNLWALNNWKPSFVVDLAKNPGGDGIVIFVGLAPPRNRQ